MIITVMLEKTLESPLDSKIKPVHLKGNLPWILIRRTNDEAPILWPPDVKSQLIGEDSCWKRLKAGGEEGGRGWDGWMASPTQWTWVWANSGRWWWTGKPGVLQSMELQRVRCDWATEQQQASVAPNCLTIRLFLNEIPSKKVICESLKIFMLFNC